MGRSLKQFEVLVPTSVLARQNLVMEKIPSLVDKHIATAPSRRQVTYIGSSNCGSNLSLILLNALTWIGHLS